MDGITEQSIQSLAQIRALPKSDLHNHAGYGGSLGYLSRYFHTPMAPPGRRFENLAEMKTWFEENVNRVCGGLKGYVKRVEAAFAQANRDGIRLLAMSFGKDEIDALGGMTHFTRLVDLLHKRFAPETVFLPELSLRREERADRALHWLEELLDHRWFRSVDICGDELAQPIANFAGIYKIAGNHRLRLRAHVGEFGSADDVLRAVETLQLHEVHHGIAAADSPWAMRWLAGHGIQLNICPTSNLMLNRVKDYAVHPIRVLVHHGVPVTINTDDLLIFGSSVSQEYMRLFHAGLLDAGELEEIRARGLCGYK